MEYKDENGNIMYGYSQQSLDKNTFWTKCLVIVFLLLLLYIVWITHYVISNNVVNNIVSRCIC